MTRKTGVTALVAVLTAAFLSITAGCGSGTSTTDAASSPAANATNAPRSLRILLVNDDGWDAPGIVALRDTLTAAGHTVTEVAPAKNESGTGAALTFGGSLQLTQQQPNVWSVTGRPADAALVGLKSVLASSPPDLVMSGINAGYNVGATTLHSGTVGAALTAAEFGVPAVAVSTDVADAAHPTASDFAATADYAARLVGAMSTRPVPLLPPGAVLNVNYPKGAGRAAGVAPTMVAKIPQVEVAYVESGAGRVVPKPDPITPRDGSGNTDLAALARHQVSVSALDIGFAAETDVLASATVAAGAVEP